VPNARTVCRMRDSRIILITGLPATGKTTLARTLAARYRLPLVAKDLIKEPLLDVLGATDAAQSRRLSDASFAILFAIARELHVAGTGMVLEGNFRPGEHEQVLRSSIPVWTSFAQILCRVDEAERVARLSRRHADPARHTGHRDSDLASAAPAAPAARGDAFLDLPGAQFVHNGADDCDVLATLDAWWNQHTL
jgi:predicted kinase